MSRIRSISLPQPCPHLAEFRSRHGGAHPFRALQDCVRAGPMGRAFIRRREGGGELELPRCSTRLCHTRHRLYACVACAAVSCHVHAAAHSTAEGDGHDIAVDVDRAELFCCRCRDQVYDPEFDAAVLAAASSSEFLSPPPPPPPPENRRKRHRVDYRPWEPGPTERLLISQNATILGENYDSNSGFGSGSDPGIPCGLRGLNNLGSTCFMNSILQALLHTPPLRNYFLSDRHNRYFCQRKRGSLRRRNGTSGGNSLNGNGKDGLKNLCLACDLDALFSAVFSGDRTPFSPAKLLYSWWQHAANLATYEQQDAHEFFISMLDGIHEKVEKDRGKLQSQDSVFCAFSFFHGWLDTQENMLWWTPLLSHVAELAFLKDNSRYLMFKI